MLTRRSALAGAAPLLMAAKPKTTADPAGTGALSCGGGTRSWLVRMESAPFPYAGPLPDGTPFLDKAEGERRGHTSPRGGVYWADQTYADNRVLLSASPHYGGGSGARIVLYLHGNQATLTRDVCSRQGIPRQLAASGLNGVLVAPQLAVDALDSSAGKFWQPGALRSFLAEAARHLGAQGYGGLEGAPVVIVAYSGGYLPAVFGLQVGGVQNRIEGLVLLDALFGEVDRYSEVVAANSRRMFFVSAYSAASRQQNATLRRQLEARGVACGEGLPRALRPGTAAFVPAPAEATHNDFVTRGFVRDPVTAILKVLARPSA